MLKIFSDGLHFLSAGNAVTKQTIILILCVLYEIACDSEENMQDNFLCC